VTVGDKAAVSVPHGKKSGEVRRAIKGEEKGNMGGRLRLVIF